MFIPENAYYLINVLIVIIYLLSIILAYKKGFLFEVLNFFGFILACLMAWFASPVLAEQYPLLTMPLVSDVPLDLETTVIMGILYPVLNVLIWFFIVLVCIKLIISILLPIFQKFSDVPVLGFFNRLAGAAFGFLNATIWAFIISLVLSLPFITNGMEIKEKSFLKPISEVSDQVIGFAMEHVDLDQMQINLEGLQIDELRNDFKEWLLTQDFNGDHE